jgi:hypothetical protein
MKKVDSRSMCRGLAERLNAGCQMTILYKIFDENVAASVDAHHSWSGDWSQHLFNLFLL